MAETSTAGIAFPSLLNTKSPADLDKEDLGVSSILQPAPPGDGCSISGRCWFCRFGQRMGVVPIDNRHERLIIEQGKPYRPS
jgi:hypothetical protein